LKINHFNKLSLVSYVSLSAIKKLFINISRYFRYEMRDFLENFLELKHVIVKTLCLDIDF